MSENRRPRYRLWLHCVLAKRPAGKRLRYRLRGIPRPLHGTRSALFFRPGRRRILPYSIQYLKRWRLAWFREDLSALFDLLRDKKIKPMIADRIPLSEARRAQELIGEGSMKGKLVLVCDGDRGPRSGREMG